MKEMQFHPVSELFPVMPEKEFATLVAATMRKSALIARRQHTADMEQRG